MCNLPLLLNSGCICPPFSVVTCVRKMKQNCGFLTFFLKVVLPIDIILSSLSVSGCGTRTVTVCCMFRCCAKMPSVVCMKIPVYRDVMQFSLMYRYQHFRAVCCFHLQGGPRTNYLTLKTEATSVSEMLELVYRHTPIYEVISYTLLGI